MKLCILDAKTLGKETDVSRFEKFGELTVYDTTSPSEVAKRIEDVDIIITNKVVLNRENLSNAKNLKLICLTATGMNNVDLDYTASREIAVKNVAGYSTASVVQHTFSLLLYIVENLRYYDEYVKSGEYSGNNIFTHLDKMFWELQDKTWGIIGLGEIGRGVAKIASAFGCKVVYYSTSGKNQNPDYERVELEELLKTSDVVSIHAPLNESTKGLIGYNELALMKKTAVLINVGRGGIVVENDLARALDENKLYGAGLDVLEKEPISIDNPLMKIKQKERLFITPHVAWASEEAIKRLLDRVEENIVGYLKNR